MNSSRSHRHGDGGGGGSPGGGPSGGAGGSGRPRTAAQDCPYKPGDRLFLASFHSGGPGKLPAAWIEPVFFVGMCSQNCHAVVSLSSVPGSNFTQEVDFVRLSATAAGCVNIIKDAIDATEADSEDQIAQARRRANELAGAYSCLLSQADRLAQVLDSAY